MKYIEVDFDLNPLLPAREVLVAELAEIGFESFAETETGVKAYIPQPEFSGTMLNDLMTSAIEDQVISWNISELPDQNWNAEWEKNFEPIIVDDRCLVRAPFHKDLPDFPLEIIIEPKMSFGTGHHATTYLVLSEMMKMDMHNKRVLDMGSGTGVLAIAAEKSGASMVDAIDIDDWAFENAVENVDRNHCINITCLKGGAEVLPGHTYDVILANINRNILQRDMHHYVRVLNPGGHILFSGFYRNDKPEMDAVARALDLSLINEQERGDWFLLHYTK